MEKESQPNGLISQLAFIDSSECFYTTAGYLQPRALSAGLAAIALDLRVHRVILERREEIA
jgi:hypothetical protein